MHSATIINAFDAAAENYDAAATVQADIAQKLVTWAKPRCSAPQSLLDIGCGTGFVAAELYRQWPEAKITALDAAPDMLRQAQRKVPHLSVVAGDASTIDMPDKFDAMFSSMALHWMPNPLAVLQHWQKWLTPTGRIFVALPVAGSFEEWRSLCRQHHIEDGLWNLPEAEFADGLANRSEKLAIPAHYGSAQEFLHSMKDTGASTARVGYRAVSISRLRKLLTSSARPMTVTFRLVFLELQARSDP